jgi:hypothetical protein
MDQTPEEQIVALQAEVASRDKSIATIQRRQARETTDSAKIDALSAQVTALMEGAQKSDAFEDSHEDLARATETATQTAQVRVAQEKIVSDIEKMLEGSGLDWEAPEFAEARMVMGNNDYIGAGMIAARIVATKAIAPPSQAAVAAAADTKLRATGALDTDKESGTPPGSAPTYDELLAREPHTIQQKDLAETTEALWKAFEEDSGVKFKR